MHLTSIVFRLVLPIAAVTAIFAQPTPITFQLPVEFHAGTDPSAAVIADFNHDGKPDVAVADLSTNSVTILINNGNGFAAPVSYAAGDKARSIATADFNLDGNPDLAVVGGATVYILLGNGDGTFEPPVGIALPGPTDQVVAADINGDGKPDLILPIGAVVVMLGNGDGTFGAPIPTNVGNIAEQLAVGDLNGDGRPDLVVRTVAAQPYEPPSYLVSLLGNGNGTFQPYQTIYPGYYAPVPYLYDVNGDGLADLIEQGLSVALGNGDGTFQPSVYYPTEGGGPPAFVDLNGDGHIDILAPGSSSVSILLGNGDGTFQQSYSYEANIDPVWAGAADFSGGGPLDVVVLNRRGTLPGFLTLLPGIGHGKLLGKRTLDFYQPLNGEVLADFNGDGILDAALVGVKGLPILLGNGEGNFQPFAMATAGPYPIGVAAGDFNGDGKQDLAVTDGATSLVYILFGNGNGTFSPGGKFFVPPYSYTIATADFNNDGYPDLVSLGAGSSGGSTVQVMLGDGIGGFQSTATIDVSQLVINFAVGDFNNDGFPDLILCEEFAGPALFLGKGDGTFQPPLYVYGHGALNLTAGDFNGDGNLDLAVLGGGNGGDLVVLLGNGNGTFVPGQSIPYAPTSGYNFINADLNGDGYPDLIADNGGSLFTFYLGNGDGTFTMQTNEYSCVAANYNSCAVAAGDLTNNGKLDLVFSQLIPVGGGAPLSPVSILINTTP
jgi:hypothetical protein